MKIIVKILLLPVTLALTLLIAFARFVCMASGIVLNILASLLFLLGFFLLFTGEVKGFLGFTVLAWLLSPYGLPMAAMWLTVKVEELNYMLKSI